MCMRCDTSKHACDRVRAERQRGASDGSRERARRCCSAYAVYDYSITRRTRRTIAPCSRWQAMPRRSRQPWSHFEAALPRIDLRQHTGEHPRLGAVDVALFVPIAEVTMDECVRLAKETAAEVADRFQVPVYLYEEASGNPARKNLEDIRRGEFEGRSQDVRPGWAPDFGPARPHPARARPSWVPACR